MILTCTGKRSNCSTRPRKGTFVSSKDDDGERRCRRHGLSQKPAADLVLRSPKPRSGRETGLSPTARKRGALVECLGPDSGQLILPHLHKIPDTSDTSTKIRTPSTSINTWQTFKSCATGLNPEADF